MANKRLISPEQFLAELRKGDVYMSEADIALGMKDPDAGMSIISGKRDYAKATTDAERAAINSAVEGVRLDRGGYTAGKDGSGYTVHTTPSSFQTSSEKPIWGDKYGTQYDELLNSYVDREEFSYDYKTDPSYSAYAKAYRREGDRATKNALALASANTGGVASSYAATAAAQAGNYYAAQLSDKIPELYNAAFNRYVQEYQMDGAALNAMAAARQMDRSIYESDLGQWNTDRNFEYGQHLDQIDYLDKNKQRQLEFALTAADNGDFSFLRSMGVNTDQIEALYGYQMENERLATQNAKFAHAMEIYSKTGDTNALASFGISTVDDLKVMWDTQVDSYVQSAAQELELMGIEIDAARFANATERAKYGDFTELEKLGVPTEQLKAQYNEAIEAEKILLQQKVTQGQQAITMNSQDIAANQNALNKQNPNYKPSEADVLVAIEAVKGGYATRDDLETLIRAGYTSEDINAITPQEAPEALTADRINNIVGTVSVYKKDFGYTREEIENVFAGLEMSAEEWAVFEAALNSAFKDQEPEQESEQLSPFRSLLRKLGGN